MIRPGDIFVVKRPTFFSNAIARTCEFWAIDGSAEYSHSGIILSADGTTFEARRRTGQYHMNDFRGLPILIGRHKDMTAKMASLHFPALILDYDGDVYPWWRILLHMIPILSRKIGTGGHLVCSELSARFLYDCGFLPTFLGYNPDHIADMINLYRDWSIVLKGNYK